MASPSPTPPAGHTDPAMARLVAVADGIGDQVFGAKLKRVFEAAGIAIEALRELDLGRYEDLAETGYPDLSMWEELAPVIRDTVMDVNQLLSTVRELFPAPLSGGIADLLGEALEEFAAATSQGADLQRRKDDVAHQVQVLSSVLASEISNLGERMRSPQIVSDRWNLLADLQEFRGKFRAAIGDMLFKCASAFVPVTRREVVPGYEQEVRDAVAARRAVTELSRVLAAHHARVKKGELAPAAAIEALIKDVDTIGRSRSYVVLRAPDKRRFVEFRAMLMRLQVLSDAKMLLSAVVEFSEFAKALSRINQRGCLMENDRELCAGCAVELERAEPLVATSRAEAAAALLRAVRRAGDLYGRTPTLDSYLRQARKKDFAALEGDALRAEIEVFRSLIASAMIA